MWPFDFFDNMFNRTFFIDISWRCLKTLIALLQYIGLIDSVNLVIFKFRNFEFDLKDNFANNYKQL